MDPNAADAKAAAAHADAQKSRWLSWFWWLNLPVVCITYWFVSKEPYPERAMFVYLAAVSVIALAATYSAKAKAEKAEAAGYENP